MSDETRAVGIEGQGDPMTTRDHGADGRGCVGAAMLAGYVDGTLTTHEHRTVEGHLADCDTCREVVAESSLAREAMGVPTDVPAAADPGGRVVTMAGRARQWWPAMGVLAAAAIALAVVIPRMMRPTDPSARPELAELVAAVGESRPFEARLTGGFKYGPLAPVMRSGQGVATDVRPEVAVAVAKLDLDADPGDVSSQAAAASGALVAGRLEDAVRGLERVTQLEPRRAAYWSDLAAAYLVRAARAGDSTDYGRALEAAERGLRLAPVLAEALFNRALALEGLGRQEEARAAWKAARNAEFVVDRLRIEHSAGKELSPWAKAAGERLAGSQGK